MASSQTTFELGDAHDDRGGTLERTIRTSDVTDDEVERVSPNGKYIQFLKEELVTLATSIRKYYKGFDTERAIEICWIAVPTTGEFVTYSGDKKLITEEFVGNRLNYEVKIMQSLDSKYIVKRVASWRNKDEGEVVIISEIYSSNMRNFIFRAVADKLRISAIRKWAVAILNGLTYMHTHERPIVHRNLRCSNIFMKANGDLKIGNMFYATYVDSIGREKDPIDLDYYVEGIEQVAPEILSGSREYDTSVDIYAFGMTLLEMIVISCCQGKRPYRECGKDRAEISRRKVEGILPEDLGLLDNEILKGFITQCLVFDPETGKRPSAASLLTCPFLESDDYDNDLVSCTFHDKPSTSGPNELAKLSSWKRPPEHHHHHHGEGFNLSPVASSSHGGTPLGGGGREKDEGGAGPSSSSGFIPFLPVSVKSLPMVTPSGGSDGSPHHPLSPSPIPSPSPLPSPTLAECSKILLPSDPSCNVVNCLFEFALDNNNKVGIEFQFNPDVDTVHNIAKEFVENFEKEGIQFEPTVLKTIEATLQRRVIEALEMRGRTFIKAADSENNSVDPTANIKPGPSPSYTAATTVAVTPSPPPVNGTANEPLPRYGSASKSPAVTPNSSPKMSPATTPREKERGGDGDSLYTGSDRKADPVPYRAGSSRSSVSLKDILPTLSPSDTKSPNASPPAKYDESLASMIDRSLSSFTMGTSSTSNSVYNTISAPAPSGGGAPPKGSSYSSASLAHSLLHHSAGGGGPSLPNNAGPSAFLDQPKGMSLTATAGHIASTHIIVGGDSNPLGGGREEARRQNDKEVLTSFDPFIPSRANYTR